MLLLKSKFITQIIMQGLCFLFAIVFAVMSIEGTRTYLDAFNVFSGDWRLITATSLSLAAIIMQTLAQIEDEQAKINAYNGIAILLIALSAYSIWAGSNKKIENDTKQEWITSPAYLSLSTAADKIQSSIDTLNINIGETNASFAEAESTITTIALKNCLDTKHKTKCRKDNEKKMKLAISSKQSTMDRLQLLIEQKKTEATNKKEATAALQEFTAKMQTASKNNQENAFTINVIWSLVPDLLSNLFFKGFLFFFIPNLLIYRQIRVIQQRYSKNTATYSSHTASSYSRKRYSEIPNVAERNFKNDIKLKKARLPYRDVKKIYGSISQDKWSEIREECLEESFLNKKQNRSAAWTFFYPEEDELGGVIIPYAATQRNGGTHEQQFELSIMSGGKP